MISKLKQIEVIYLGGTFASVGNPLSPVTSSALNQLLTQALDHIETPIAGENSAAIELNITAPITISDSSQLDSQAFIHVGQALSQIRHTPCLIITGTDTLSFLSSYIAISGSHPNCCILASMDTLSDPNTGRLNDQSYAYKSFNAALDSLSKSSGVRCMVDGHQLDPLTLTKLHTRSPEAFSDHWRPEITDLHQPNHSGNVSLPPLSDAPPCAVGCNIPDIAVCFATPSHLQLTHQLIQLASAPPDALLLVGYGAGNFIYNQQIQTLLETVAQSSPILVSTQVNFGGCSWDYAAGSWLSELAVSSGSLNYPTSYAALLHICSCQIKPSNRQTSLIELISALTTA